MSFNGDFAGWEEASRASTGYASDEILRRVRAAALRVRDGVAAFERDAVVFDKPDPNFPLLAGLLRAAALTGHLNVMDFGGSLGSAYFQCREFLCGIPDVRWNVVEQPHFVACGRAEFAGEVLHFHTSAEECLRAESVRVNVLLLSGVLQYLSAPYRAVAELLGHRIPHVIVDRASFQVGGRERLTVQTVPEAIYPASYPAWFFHEPRFVAAFTESGYRLVSDFEGRDSVELAGATTYFKGFIFERTA